MHFWFRIAQLKKIVIIVFPWPYITVPIRTDNSDPTHSNDSISSSWNRFGPIINCCWLKIETKRRTVNDRRLLSCFDLFILTFDCGIVVKIMCHERDSEFPWLRNIFESTADWHIALMFSVFYLIVIYIHMH